MQSILIPAISGIIVDTPQRVKKIPYNRHKELYRKFRVAEIEKET